MKKGDQLNAYVKEAGRNNVSAERVSELMVLIAGSLYWLAEEVSQLNIEQMNAEAGLESALVLAELKLIAGGMAISKAHQAAKNEVVEQRAKYIESKGEYERWRGKLKGAQNLLTALQMRLSYLTKERQYSNFQPPK